MASLPITDTTPWVQYTATASQTNFTVPFVFFALTDVSVYQTPNGVAPNDATQKLTYSSAYTVSQNGNYTGTVILNSGASVGDIITIVRAMPDQRLNYYTAGGPFTADAVNNDFESEVLMIQQNTLYNDQLSPHYNLSAPINTAVDMVLPQLAANQTWSKNAGNTAIVPLNLPTYIISNTSGSGGTDNHLVRWDGSNTLIIKDSAVAVDNSGNMSGATWNGSVIGSTYGGTGVNNGGSTLTLGGSLTTAGAYTTTLTATGNTSVTLPTSGTLVNTAVTTLSSLSTIGTITSGTWHGSVISGTYGGTGVNNGSNTLTLAGNLSTSGAHALTLTLTADSNVTLPTSGTLCTTSGSTSITTLGTVTVGTWNATVIGATYGGTGVNNGSSTFTFGGNTAFSGAYTFTGTLTNNTTVTFPTSGTLVNTAVTTLSSLTSVGTIATGTWNATPVTVTYGGSGAASFTAYSVICGGTTSTGAFQNVSGLGTSGYVLTSNGAGALPSWQAVPGGVSTVSGTANQINVINGSSTPTLSLSPTVVFPGTVTLNADPVSALQAVTKQYADAISQGLTFKDACYAATTANLTATYANGASGVGATLTNATTQAAFSIDSVSPALNARVLVKNQSTTYQDGIYTVTTVGDASTNWVLTRATDFDQPSEIAPGDFILINAGTTNTGTGWVQTATVTTIGTDAIAFSQFGGSSGVTSVSGTANRISSTGGSTPVIDIDAAYVGQSSITTLGTISSGTWHGTVLGATYGGTGVNNGSSTITLGGNISTAGALTTSGAFGITLTASNTTSVTLPTTGTLVNSAVATLSSLTSVGTIGTGTWQGTVIGATYGGTGVNNGSSTITLGGNLTTAGAFATTLTVTNTTSVTLPTTGTLVNTAVTSLSSLATVGTITSGTWNGTVVDVAHGGSGAASFTAYAVLCGGTTSTGAHQSIAGVGTSGQVLTSNGAGALPTFQAASGGGTTWNVVPSGTTTLATGNGYILTGSSGLTCNLPASAAVGDSYIVAQVYSASVTTTIQCGVGQTIYGSTSTTSSGGTLKTTPSPPGSIYRGSMQITCITANTTFIVQNQFGLPLTFA